MRGSGGPSGAETIFRIADALSSGGPEQGRVGGSESDEGEKLWMKGGASLYFSFRI